MISKDEDKYSTDFGKCLNVIRTTLHADPMVEVLVLGSIGGRVDQGIGLLGEMMRELKNDKKAAEGQRTKFWLVSEASLTFVLMPGKNVVAFPRGCVEGRSSQTGGDEIKRSGSHEPLFTPNVGILPLFGKAHISTRGLEWDVADWRTEMGGQISTSNHIMADEVTVWTEKEVLFTVELNGAHFET